MSVQRIARRYAKSLFDVAKERGELELVHDEVIDFQKLADQSPDLRMLLKSPVIRPKRKSEIFHQIFDGKLSALLANFLDIVIRKHREGYVLAICDAFLDMYNLDHHISKVVLTTAQELSPESQEAIVAELKKSGKVEENVELTTRIDESLIGGFVLQFNNQLYDASVASQLEELKKSFSENSYIKKL